MTTSSNHRSTEKATIEEVFRSALERNTSFTSILYCLLCVSVPLWFQLFGRGSAMQVLVIGRGGREHALVWKLAQSPRVKQVFCAPGNAGTSTEGINVPIDENDSSALIRFVKKENIGLTVVGPEAPLAAGIVDAFQKERLRIFGPTKAAAQIEASKVFAKKLMRDADVPSADFRVFDHPEPARHYLLSREYAVTPDGKQRPGPFPPSQVFVEDGVRYLH